MKIKKQISENINSPRAGLLGFFILFSFAFVFAGTTQQANANKVCGVGSHKVNTKLDLGCNGANKNPIIDLAFALIRFLSYGVGIAVVASVVLGGVQYTAAEGNPEKSAQAKSRIQTSIAALIFYLFIFSIAQYLIPGGLFHPG